MTILLILLASFYLLVVPSLAIRWLAFFNRDSQLSRSEKQAGLLIIAIAATLWIFVVPFAYLELLRKLEHEQKNTLLSVSNLNY
ncbi:MAG: hypothetical protein LH660_18175 [Phormidesmis sp. CAN_BIN36]|nr:hypothetical protein [Phormidesmis sp. CAN_BIN36]